MSARTATVSAVALRSRGVESSHEPVIFATSTLSHQLERNPRLTAPVRFAACGEAAKQMMPLHSGYLREKAQRTERGSGDNLRRTIQQTVNRDEAERPRRGAQEQERDDELPAP